MISFAFFRQFWLAVGLLLAMIATGSEAPTWICFFAMLLVTVRLMIDVQIVKPIPKWAVYTVAVALFIEVFVQFRSIFEQESSTTLLLGLCALKILDFETKRDIKFLFILGLLVLSLKPLYSLELTWIPVLAFSFFCLWMGLMTLVQKPRWGLMLKWTAQSLPFAGLLFFLFPRIIVPWAQKKGATQSVVGFSESMDPGTVSSIATQTGLAFRVQFEGNTVLDSKNLYWRGAVLEKTTGLKWEPLRFQAVLNQEDESSAGGLIQRLTPILFYEVLLEPDGQGYLFTLDRPLSVSAPTQHVIHSVAHAFKTATDHAQSFIYDGKSDLSSTNADPPTDQDLQTPDENLGVDGFIKHLRSFATPASRLAELDHFFADKTFTYTLSPGSYQKNGFSEFLFRRKKGFCQHYAGAYATIARMLGIPSRVILGFQGGTYNSAGDFWEISARDAHAWVEVFLQGHWVRKDPTALVAPLRIELGANDFFDLPEEQRKFYTQDLIEHKAQHLWLTWWAQLSAFWGNLNFKWTMFLLDYNTDQSHRIFMDLFKSTWKWLIIGFFLCWIVLRGVKIKRKSRSPVPVTQSLVRALRAITPLAATNDQTPLELLQQPRNLPPEAAEFVRSLAASYEKQIYHGTELSSQSLQKLTQDWAKHQRELKKAFSQSA